MVKNTLYVPTLRSTLQSLLLWSVAGCLISCGGRGSDSSSEVTLGGAPCETGVAFNDNMDQGYDSLYNFQNQPDPAVSVVFDPATQPPECVEVAGIYSVIPWIRINDSDLSGSGNSLRFELVTPGGRNESILAEYPISDTTKESIHGTFSYTVDLLPSGDNNGATCDVSYNGSYCPMGVPNNSSSSRALNFSADGSVDCSVAHLEGSAPTQCHGTIGATNVTLNVQYYGE